MKMLCFASRNTKEMVRDKLNLMFGIGFPVVLLLLLTAIQANIPVELFSLDHLTPGVCVFGLSFVSLFAGLLISKDRGSSLVLRLFTSPMTGSDFIFGYTLPLVIVSLAQIALTVLVAVLLGLRQGFANILLLVVVLLPVVLLNIGLGLLFGTVLNDRQVGGICGALLTNLTAWLSGTWFDLKLVGGVFEAIANAFPFVHAVNAGRAALSGDCSAIFPDILWVIGYSFMIMLAAIIVFSRRMKSDWNGK